MKSRLPHAWLAFLTLVAIFVTGCARGGATSEEDWEDGGSFDPDASVDGGSSDGSGGGRDGAIDDEDGGKPGDDCTPKTCADFDAECGYIADGCGKVENCGGCADPKDSCGGSGLANRCGRACEPRSCEDLGVGCGLQGDGCGNTLDCGSCDGEGEYCGGAGASQCGRGPAVHCKTKEEACDDMGLDCGPVGDGCGGIVECGASCPLGQSCGGGGVHNVCGALPPDQTPCIPLTKAQACGGKDCGQQSNGCGQLIDCGSCAGGLICGAGGPSQCGAPACTKIPQATACAGKACGEVGDGCGGTWSCGSCTGGNSCGGGGVAFQCGKPFQCVSKTCAERGYDCGQATDGCGNVIDCGPLDCGIGKVCGGGGDNRCGGSGASDPCPNGTTSVSGIVYMPNGTVPLYGALVYVPKSLADIPAFTNTVSCERCDAQVPPTALAYAISGTDGSFTLKGVPAGNVPLVIQVGRFRRKVDINVNACQNNALSPTQTRLPTRHNEASVYDHLPKIAMVTGLVDALECVLRRVGIEDSQFSKPAGGARIHIVQADSYGGSRGPKLNGSDTSQPRGSEIYGNAGTLSTYDMVLLACQNQEISHDAYIGNIVNYANAGGRIFATHFSYTWLNKLDPFKSTATWKKSTATWTGPETADVDTSFAKGQAFAQWLRNVGANVSPDPTKTQINITEPRDSVTAVDPTKARKWISMVKDSKTYVQHMTFNTPVGAAADQQCGRVVFSDFHVTGGSSLSSKTFPEECAGSTTLSPQEKALAFMLFDLSACIQSDNSNPQCSPKTCGQQGIACGKAGDGCGNIVDCGSCTGGLTCGGGGVAGQCGKQECVKFTCDELGLGCGPAGDGCGGTLDCGSCSGGKICGGGGPGVCGLPSCTPVSCDDQGIECGPAGNGCGNVIQCGSCPPGTSCGGGGIPGQCGYSDASACVPRSCDAQGIECGPAGDGCGNLLACGDCSHEPGTSCGGGGIPGQCGTPCQPKSCADLGIECGPAGDGCGGILACGDCKNGQSCGGGGVPGRCGGGQCQPKSCKDLGFECGPAADGCGKLLDCGSCKAPQTCGGSGEAGKCGGVR